jgi:AAA ATPase-like protein
MGGRVPRCGGEWISPSPALPDRARRVALIAHGVVAIFSVVTYYAPSHSLREEQNKPMRVKRLAITNFRAIERLDMSFEDLVTVIVGPNAIGKTTILEGMRLCKGVLSPRTQGEANQVLISLGAIAPHLPNQLQLDTLQRDIGLPVKIEVEITYLSQKLNA